MTIFSLLLLCAFFVFIGTYHRYGGRGIAGGQAKIGLVAISAALFVVVGSGEYDLSLAMIMGYGWAGLSFVLGLVVSFLTISLFANRIWQIRGSAKKFYLLDGYVNFTTPDFLHLAHGKTTSLLATFIVSSCFFGLYVLQVFLGGLLLSAASGVSVAVASTLIAATVVLYAILGGFYSLFRTDLFQAGLMYLSLVIATAYSVFSHGEVVSFGEFAGVLNERALDSLRLSSLADDPTVLGVFLLTVCAAFSGADLWQRVNVSDGSSAARRALQQGALALFVFGVLLYVFAIDAISVMEASKLETTTPFASYLGLVLNGSETIAPWPAIVIAVFSIGLLAAFMSTADTCLLLTASSLQNEIHRWTGGGASEGGGGNLELDRKVTAVLLLVFGGAGLYMSLLTPNVVEQFLIVLGALAVLGVPVFATLLGFGNKFLVSAAIIIGAAITVYLGYVNPSLNAGWGLLLPCLPGLVCFASRNKNTLISG